MNEGSVRGVAKLEDRCLLSLTGEDRVRYLNGQVTQDVAGLPPGESRHACVTNAKGRMEGDLFLTVLADSLLLDAPAELQETLAQRLERYIIADDVELHDATDEWRLYHLLGIDVSAVEVDDDCILARNNRFGVDGIDLFARREQAALEKFDPLSAEMLEDLRIRLGVPVWGRELDSTVLPPEAQLEERSISYTKGCYIGQEVISRMRSAGKTNRRLARLLLSEDLPADLTGALLWNDDSTPERPAGTLTSWTQPGAPAPRAALGYVARRAENAETFALRLPDGRVLPEAVRRR